MRKPAIAFIPRAALLIGLVAGAALEASHKRSNPDGIAATSSHPPESDDFFIAKEREVWDALMKKDKAADAGLLADDFVGLYDTGFGTKSEHVNQMDDHYAIDSYTIQDARILRLSAEAALVLYKSTCTGSGEWKQYCAKPVYVSSLWVRRAGHWLGLFSQDTQAASSP
jgi:hypothetical protein